MRKENLLIIGGGVSGMTAAVAAARFGEKPVILEQLDQPGKKLLATGNGRCNLMNLNPPVYYGEPDFALRVLGADYLSELTDFWNSMGLYLRYDPEGRGYPCTFQAATVRDALTAELRRLDVPVLTGRTVRRVRADHPGFTVESENGECFSAQRLILAAGGAAQPKLGGSGDGVSWLRELGHNVVPLQPALTPLRTEPRSVSGLSGIRVRCALRVCTDGKNVHREAGELLFTDGGISGICVMQCSRFAVPGRSECIVDFVPDLFPDGKDLTEALRARRARFAPETPTALLQGICVPRLAYAVCKQAGIPLRGERTDSLSDDQLDRIASVLRGYRLPITGVEDFDRAQVSAGGLDCAEVSPENLESQIHPGLHITGELLNVDGDCGGYNLMFACASGLRAGMNGRRKSLG